MPSATTSATGKGTKRGVRTHGHRLGLIFGVWWLAGMIVTGLVTRRCVVAADGECGVADLADRVIEVPEGFCDARGRGIIGQVRGGLQAQPDLVQLRAGRQGPGSLPGGRLPCPWRSTRTSCTRGSLRSGRRGPPGARAAGRGRTRPVGDADEGARAATRWPAAGGADQRARTRTGRVRPDGFRRAGGAMPQGPGGAVG
jgi:hypothetical protein